MLNLAGVLTKTSYFYFSLGIGGCIIFSNVRGRTTDHKKMNLFLLFLCCCWLYFSRKAENLWLLDHLSAIFFLGLAKILLILLIIFFFKHEFRKAKFFYIFIHFFVLCQILGNTGESANQLIS